MADLVAQSMVGPRVRQLRGLRGMTQEQLAEAADISVSFVSMVERGERHPRLPMLAALARALDTTAPDLLSQPSEGEDSLLNPLVELVHARQLTAPDVQRLVAVARLMFPASEGGEGAR